MRSFITAVFLVLAAFITPTAVWAQTPAQADDVPAASGAEGEGGTEADPALTLNLARALEARVTVWRTPRGRVMHVSHCRRAPRGCRARIGAFARYIAEVSATHHLDPFVLAAMAVRESGLDPFAEGPAGERGIVQLHPRGIGGHVRFVTNEAYRRGCMRTPGACQREVLEVGATHLSDAIALCGGLNEGLGAYNRGVCGDSAYTRRVLRERARLIELAKVEEHASPVTVAVD